MADYGPLLLSPRGGQWHIWITTCYLQGCSKQQASHVTLMGEQGITTSGLVRQNRPHTYGVHVCMPSCRWDSSSPEDLGSHQNNDGAAARAWWVLERGIAIEWLPTSMIRSLQREMSRFRLVKAQQGLNPWTLRILNPRGPDGITHQKRGPHMLRPGHRLTGL